MTERSNRAIDQEGHKSASTLWNDYNVLIVHMLGFGIPAFILAYNVTPVPIIKLLIFGTITCSLYVHAYIKMFGLDEVKWMFINAALGLFGSYSEIGWLLSLFGKQIDGYAIYVHIVPFTYFILATFLLRQFLIDVTRSRDNIKRKSRVERFYIAVLALIFLVSFLTKKILFSAD